MKKVFTIELSKKDGTLLTNEKAPLYYVLSRKMMSILRPAKR